jgi:phosphate:Na+ symporter
MAHFLFNFLGALWPILFLQPFLMFVDLLVPGDPYATDQKALLLHIPTHIAAFHTAFNCTNTVIFLTILGPFERLIIRILPDKGGELDNTDLVYLETPFGSTPEIAIEAAAREVDRMAQVTEVMVSEITSIIEKKSLGDPAQLDKIFKAEDLTDRLEHKITEYLAALVHGHLSTAASHEALSLLSMINDLERIGDHGERIANIFKRAAESNTQFSDKAYADLHRMGQRTFDVLREMRKLILTRDSEALEPALKRERALDALRDDLRTQHLDRLQNQECTALAGLIYSDIINSFEKMGDHAYNVVQATLGHSVSAPQR